MMEREDKLTPPAAMAALDPITEQELDLMDKYEEINLNSPTL
jgi:hypothetical protein